MTNIFIMKTESLKALKITCFILIISILLMFSFSKPAHSIQVKLIQLINKAGSKHDKLFNPMDIFFDKEKQELYIADAGKHRILIYDQNGRFKAEIKNIEGIQVPISMSVDKQGRMYFIDTQLTALTIVDYRGRLFDIYSKEELFGNTLIKPYNLIRRDDGSISVLGNDMNFYHINIDAKKIEPLKMNVDEFDPELKMVLEVTTDREGRYYFADMRPGQVVVFDSSGNYLNRIGEPGGHDGQISRPTGVAVDKKGRTFVVSTVRHKVLCYGPEGDYLGEFGGKGRRAGTFHFPTKIESDGNNRLYVLDPALERVQVFEIN